MQSVFFFGDGSESGEKTVLNAAEKRAAALWLSLYQVGFFPECFRQLALDSV